MNFNKTFLRVLNIASKEVLTELFKESLKELFKGL